MNISNYQKILFRSDSCRYTTKISDPSCFSTSWSLTKAAALLAGIILGYGVAKKLEDDPEIEIYQKTHPNAARSYFGFGPFIKASTTGPFYHCTQEKNLIEIFEHGAVKICCHGLFIENKSKLNLKEDFDTTKLFQAFVSKKPEFTYGRYALVFNDGIRELDDGFPRGFVQDEFALYNNWIQFTEDLPLDARCFDKIIFRPKDYREEERELERKELEEKISKIAGRSIIVEINRG